MTEAQAMNREEYFRRYCQHFIKVYGVQHFQSWVFVDGVRYDIDIKRSEPTKFDDGYNGFIQ